MASQVERAAAITVCVWGILNAGCGKDSSSSDGAGGGAGAPGGGVTSTGGSVATGGVSTGGSPPGGASPTSAGHGGAAGSAGAVSMPGAAGSAGALGSAGGAGMPGAAGAAGASGAAGAQAVVPGDAECSVDGWCWVAPTPHGHGLHSMDGAEGHLWAVGEGGVIVHRDPTGVFDTRVWPGLPRLDGVVAITADNAWAVGEDGLVLHYLNGAWSVVQSGFVEDLRAVFAFGPGDVWVGGSGRYADAALLRNQTFGFETHTTGPVYTPLVSFIFATSPSDVFVGGLGTPAASLIHYDGSDWSYHTELLLRLPNLSLLAMAAFRSELYVSTDQQDGELYRRTSAGWESFHTDRGVDTGNQAIYDLAATNDRLLIAGHWDLVGYDGAQLTREHGTRTAGGQHCVHADASGAFLGAPGGRIYQEQASGFELAYGSPWEGVGDSAQVVARAADDLWWIGERRLHFDGLAWSAFDAPYPATAVHRGEPIYLASNAEVYRETPAGFELVATAPRELSALWVSPTGQMFAADGGALLRFDGVDWHEYGLPNPLYAHPHAIHGTADDNVWVVGSNTAVRWDGTQWNNHWDSVLDSDWLTTVHVLSPDSMWTGGANTNPHHWNGTGFESWEGSMPMWIRGIAAFADDDVWITGTENGLPAVTSHFDGTSWTVKDTGCAHPLYELHVSDANTLWAAGPGALLRWVRP